LAKARKAFKALGRERALKDTGDRNAEKPANIRKVSTKGQVVLPKELRDSLGIQCGDSVEFFRLKDGSWCIRKPVEADVFERFRGSMKNRRRFPLNTREFINEIRGTVHEEG